MHTVEDYLAKVQVDKVLYINKIPLGKIIPKDIPVLNPMTLKYRQYWEEEIKKCIDGFWVEHKGEYKYVPGVLYFYGTHWHILLNDKEGISKTKKIARPLVRDLEWIKFYLLMEARGFSGFADDDEYSCHRELALPEEERTKEFLGKGCYNKKGQLKTYVPAREYLWKYHDKPLGKPLYENMAQNVVDLESRGCLAKGTKVRMFDGSVKNAEDIVEGDKLMGKDSTARNVIWTHSGTTDLYKISHGFNEYRNTRQLQPLEVNKNHILSVHHRMIGNCNISIDKALQLQGNRDVLPGVYRYDTSGELYDFSIKYSRVGEFYGFHLDGDNEYLLADYTVDHNTGKSYTMSGIVGHNFGFNGAQDFDEFWKLRKTKDCLSSETLIGAIDSKYSGDLVKKVKLGLESFVGEFQVGDKVIPPPLQVSYSGQWESGKTIIQEVDKKVGGQWVKVGSRSKIQHRTFMDNEFAANGTRGSVNILDEVGFCYNLLEILVQMKECTADGALKFGSIWMTGTGGDMEGGSTGAVMSVFFDPKTYDCVEFEDFYENSGKNIGFFIPAWMGLNQFKDDLGNTNYKSAIQYLLNQRAKLAKGKDRTAYDGELCQRPIFPSEVFLISGGNILPTGMLKDVLSNLETSNNPADEGVLGHMKLNSEGKPEFVVDVDDKLRDCDWPVKKGEDHTGAIRIWEQPNENAGFGYYLAGNDPYDQDKAPNSVSLGSLLIMKRASPGVSPYDVIVAEYTARPETANQFYEQCRLLLMYYSTFGSCLYENEKIGIKTYLVNNNCAYLLAPTPNVLKSNISSNVDRQYGQHMSLKVKDEAEIMLRDWLIASAGDGKLNLHNIRSKPLLKELINYNKIGNFDRVIALMLCVIQMTQMYKIVSEEVKEEVQNDPFFDRPLFAHSLVNNFAKGNIGINFN